MSLIALEMYTNLKFFEKRTKDKNIFRNHIMHTNQNNGTNGSLITNGVFTRKILQQS